MNESATGTSAEATGSTITVLYDGACPLCSREIAHYRRRPGAERLRWVDASRDGEAVEALGITQEDALARFHVCDTDGNWHVGAPGFVLLWSKLHPYVYLARMVRVLHLLPLMEWGYERFLRWRGRRRCQVCSS
jgi:predicted DCC family thiol-disulfide oxidoreductase YuxK